MDSKDFRLLVALHQDARQSLQSLGRIVSLSAPAVRERLHHLEERGILQDFWLTPDPSLVGRGDLLVFFNGEWKHEHAEKLLKLRDVAWVALKMDGGLTVQLWPQNPNQALKNLVDTLGARPSGQASSEGSDLHPLHLIDWQIIEALFKRPRMPLSGLCELTGLSPKTVRKHIRMLTEGRFVYITPRLGSLSDPGELIYTMAVFGKVIMSELSEILGGGDYFFLINSTETPPGKYLLCRSASLADVTKKSNTISGMENVESVIVTLNREQLVATEFIYSLIRHEVLKLQNKM